MRTNITNNLIPNNYFIRRKKPIFIDSTNKIYIKQYGSTCSNLELIYKNQTNTFTNQNLKDVKLDDLLDVEINGTIFNSEISTQGKIYPTYYFNTGLWKTINNNYICDDINDVLIDYPINLISPNLIVIDKEDWVINFKIQDSNIFQDQDTFSVYLTPQDFKLPVMFQISNNIKFNTNQTDYQVSFNSDLFLNKRYTFSDNKYYIAIQSNTTQQIYLSDPQKYVFVTSNLSYSTIKFNANKQDLNYIATKNSNLLINCYVSGLPINSQFNFKIQDLHDSIPIFYSAPILFTENTYYTQDVIIPDDINLHKYNIELVYNNLNIIDLNTGIIIDLDYSYQINVLNALELKNLTNTSSFNLVLYVDMKFINSVINVSLDNYFIENIIVTNDNYYNLIVPIKLNETFEDGRYQVRVQVPGEQYYGKSPEFIYINVPNFKSIIMPNFGYNSIPFQYNPIYHAISNIITDTVPYGVTHLDINIIYNNTQITGLIQVKGNSLLTINYGILMINNREIINIITNNFVINRITNYSNNKTNLNNQIIIKYICESGYIIQLQNWDNTIKSVKVSTANNLDSNNLLFFGNYDVLYTPVYGYHIKINQTSFDFTGELYFYVNNIFVGKIDIIDYPINIGLNLVSNTNNNITINSIVSGTIVINNYNKDFPFINYFNLYFVDDLYGNNPYYLTSVINISNNLYSFSFRYTLNFTGTKYLMIIGNNHNFTINQIINVPIVISIAPEVNESVALVKTTNLKSITSENANLTNLSLPAPVTIIGVYTTFDKAPNKTTPSNFLQTYGLYKYTNASTLLGPSYGNYNGYLILQPDSISNGISQTNTTLDTFTSFFISQLANKQINLITVPSIFKDTYTVPDFVTTTHTFEYYNNQVLNNEQINIQSSLCSNVVQNNQLITDISLIKQNFLQSYNNQVRNYTGQNVINAKVAQVTTNTDNPPRFAWIENLGYYISQYFQLSINNVEIEKITSDWINIWNEINLPVGKKAGNNKMIGNVPSLTRYNSNKLPSYKLRIPLPFYFSRYMNAGLSLPLIALLHSDVKLTLQMEKLENLIINDPLTKFSALGRPKLSLELKYIYLEEDERRKFATSKHEYLIEQENYRNYSHYGSAFSTKLNFMQPVKDLYWFCQPKANTSSANNKQYWNYTNSKYYQLLSNYDRYDEDNPITELSKQNYAQLYAKYPKLPYIPMYINNQLSNSDVPFPTKSPVNHSTLRVNGQWRFNDDSNLTQLQYFHKYKNIPLNGLNVYPFCLYPNEYQPSGAINFSAMADTYFELATDDGAYNVSIIARNYNLLRIMSGQAGLAFEL